MPTITKIEQPIFSVVKKKRVAAYARVSMDTELLQHSLSAQISHFSSFIQENPEWEYVGVYSDYGITGTSTKNRDGFKRLIADCDAGKIDIVLVKSVSRFARDTVDTLKTTRRLKAKGIDVYFERENVHSISDEGELLLTLLASFAQAESRSISENVTWRVRKKFEEGIPNGHKATFGYRWDGEMYRIIPEEGKVVREIFDRYLAGEPAYSIAKELKERGVVGQKGLPIDETTIKFMVTNISYTGTLLLQKNFFTEGHVRKTNRGELPQYAVADMFEPLATEEELQRAIAIREQRADAMPNKDPILTPFSGKVKCGNCGCSFSRRTTKFGKKWVCNTRERKGIKNCDLIPFTEKELIEATMAALKLDSYDEEAVRAELETIIVHYDCYEFRLKNGQIRRIIRKYENRTGAFTRKIFCPSCGHHLCKDIWRFGAERVKTTVWLCYECNGVKRILDEEVKEATKSFLGAKNYEAHFQQQVERVEAYEDTLVYKFKDGRIMTWQRK